MKPISAPLQALFATRQFQACGLYSFLLVGGGMLNYSAGDRNISWSSVTYSAGGTVGPYFDTTSSRALMHQKIGTEVDTLTFDVIPGASLIDGAPFLSFVRQGGFDGAEMSYYGAYWPRGTVPNATGAIVPTGIILKMTGRVAEVDCGRSLATFNVNSHLELLNTQMPRNLYQSGCVNSLFDAGCTLNAADFSAPGTVLSGSTATSINATLSAPSVSYNLGYVTFTSGVNNGVSRSIKAYTQGSPSNITFIAPFPSAPAISDTFTIFQGCNKLQSTCSQFNNLPHFRGTPFIPAAETAI